MANNKTPNSFLQWQKTMNEDPGESHSTERGSNFYSTVLDIKWAERARWAALTNQVDRLIASQQAHSNAVLQRLGLSVKQEALPPPQPPACPRRNAGYEMNHIQTSVTSPRPEHEDLQPGLQMNPSYLPTPPRTPSTRGSRLPVKTGRTGKKLVDGYMLQSVTPLLEETMKKFEQFQLNQLPSPQPPEVARRSTFVPAPPSAAATNLKRGPRRGTTLRPLKVDKDELLPLDNNSESLSLCFKQLNSEDWEKKMEGLQIVQDLVRHHPEQVQTKLHEVCLVLSEEVKNLRSTVACAAMDTIAELYLHLGKAMDPEAERTGRALLLKLAQTTSAFIHQHANQALDALVEVCSPSRVLNTLLNTGLSHRNSAVRGSTAQHLHQLMDIIGEDQTLTAGNTFAERFVTAVCQMSTDAAPEVRKPGQMMLQALHFRREFRILWKKVIPMNDRPPLVKILKKMRQQMTT